MRNSKGITLIALIITIIVMLILVGVTVNVAMQGGLFGTAREASSETTRQAEKDQLISAVLGGLQTGGTFDITKVSLPAGAKWITSKDDTTVLPQPSPNGNWVMTDSGNKFYVDKDGNVLDDEPESSDPVQPDPIQLPQSINIGSSDNTVTATLSSDGTLTLSGTGPIKSFTKSDIIEYLANQIGTDELEIGLIQDILKGQGDQTFADLDDPDCQAEMGLTQEQVNSLKIRVQGIPQVSNIVIGEGITTLGAYMFCGIGSSSINIVLPNTLERIEDYAFAESNFGSIYIPSNVNYIGENVFKYWGKYENTQTINFQAANLDGITVNDNTIKAPPSNLTINYNQ